MSTDGKTILKQQQEKLNIDMSAVDESRVRLTAFLFEKKRFNEEEEKMLRFHLNNIKIKSKELCNTYIKIARIDISKSCSQIEKLTFNNFNLMNKLTVLEEKIKILKAKNEEKKTCITVIDLLQTPIKKDNAEIQAGTSSPLDVNENLKGLLQFDQELLPLFDHYLDEERKKRTNKILLVVIFYKLPSKRTMQKFKLEP